MTHCSGCNAEVPKRRYPSGRLFQPKTCSPECAKIVAIRSGRVGGKITAPKHPLYIEPREVT